MRGLKGSSFGKAVKKLAGKGAMALVNMARNQLISGIPGDFRKMAERWSTIEMDLEKELVRCDNGPWLTTEQWDEQADLGIFKMQILKAGMHMWKDMGRKFIKIKPQKPDMPETTIQFDNGQVWSLKQVFDQHKNDPINNDAIKMAQLTEKTDYAKDITLKK